MNILHVSASDAQGGAAIAMQRLHRGLLSAGENSMVAACSFDSENPKTISLGGKFSRRILMPTRKIIEERIFSLMARRPEHSAYTTFSLWPSLNASRLNAIAKDILHLHWVNGGCLTPFDIARITGPVVWTMHDTWPFTGGCHYFGNCSGYISQCGNCPELCSTRKWDFSALHWQAKSFAYKTVRPVFVAPSWAHSVAARKSGLLASTRIEVIPNGIATDTFKPVDQLFAKRILGLPVSKHIIMFSAFSAIRDKRKGFDLLLESLRILSNQGHENIHCLVLGAEGYKGDLPFPASFLGTLHDDISLVLAYGAADIFVCPSREESFSQTTLEALSCAAPVVGFAIGGIPDMVENGVTGRLAVPHDPLDLAKNIAVLLADEPARQRMRAAAREKIEREFSLAVVAQQYIELYNDLVTFSEK